MRNLSLAICILFHEKVDQTVECIESFLNSEFDIYILNNGSSNSSRQALGNFCLNLSQVKIFDSDVNLGVAVGRNYLIQHTREKWLFFVDNDIKMETHDWQFKIVDYIDNYSNVEVFIPKLFNVHESAYLEHPSMKVDKDKVKYIPTIDNLLNCFPGGASIINRNLFQRLGLYDERMFVGMEDFEVSIRGILQAKPVRAMLIDDIELIHEHRAVMKVNDKQAVRVRYNTEKHEESFNRIKEKHGMVLDDEWKPWVRKQIKKMLLSSSQEKSCNNFVSEFFIAYLEQEIDKNQKIAVWGGGEIGLALISQSTKLAENVEFVIDKNVDNQGKRIEGTKIIIRSPQYLISNPMDIIIVATLKYTDEIIAEIRSIYNLQSKIICSKGIIPYDHSNS